MRPSARHPFRLALAAGLCLGLSGTAALAGDAVSGAALSGTSPVTTTAAGSASSTPSLGPAFGPSTPAQIALAEHLRARGVIFYGAFWCQHCFRQKVLFGEEAGNRLPYVECAKDETGAKTCEAAGVVAYPTWVMGRERKVGVQTLQELATWSGYHGPIPFPTSRGGN
ncbi:MAG: hypothetical protein ACKO0M_05420 [Cyanobium sp.]